MIKNDFAWASENRARILAEWARRYDGKAAKKNSGRLFLPWPIFGSVPVEQARMFSWWRTQTKARAA